MTAALVSMNFDRSAPVADGLQSSLGKNEEEINRFEKGKDKKVISNSTTNGGGNGKVDKNEESKKKNSASSGPAAAITVPSLKGTLVADVESRQHIIKGKWNFMGADPQVTPSQDFEFMRHLPSDVKDPSILPLDGLFNGSFAMLGTDKKGRKSITLIQERDLYLTFTTDSTKDESFVCYRIKGRGSNRFGEFEVKGVGKKNPDTEIFSIDLKKTYIAVPPSKTRPDKELPAPTPIHHEKVVSLQGKLLMSDVDGTAHHRVDGKWSSGLNFLKADAPGLCNPFELVHKCTLNNCPFPVTGKYTGWFLLNNEGGEKTKIPEKDVFLRFKKNSAGGHNVEGKGSNVFGKYSITGTLSKDNVLLIFRHFHIVKDKRQSVDSQRSADRENNGVSGSTTGEGSFGAQNQLSPETSKQEPILSLDDVEIEEGDDVPIIKKPETGQYSAVMRGTLKVNDDLAHTCAGKWALAREHFESDGRIKNYKFRFGIESQHVQGNTFPFDSDKYKGCFNMKRGSKQSSVVDKKIVLKYRKNNQGSYNVVGKGYNSVGVFNLIGNLVPISSTSGQVELYRTYDPSTLRKTTSSDRRAVASKGMNRPPKLPVLLKPPTESRKSSTRQVKAPAKLEDEHHQASNLNLIMRKCLGVLQWLREKDVTKQFGEPVDPVALKIPNYYQVIKNPMDFSTIKEKITNGEVTDHQEFAQLVRLVFNNAMKFTVDESHFVHKTAKNLAATFNHKFKDIEKFANNQASSKNHGSESGSESKNGITSMKKKSEGESDKKKTNKKRDRNRERDRDNNFSGISESSKKKGKKKKSEVSASGREGYVPLSDYKKLQEENKKLKDQLKKLLDSRSSQAVRGNHQNIIDSFDFLQSSDIPAPTSIEKKPSSKYNSGRSKTKRDKPSISKPSRSNQSDDDSLYDHPLSFKEQHRLTLTINKLPEEKLQGVITIIRENMKLSPDDDEIDLEIDQLDTITQRKLQRYVNKNTKRPKRPAPYSKPKTIRPSNETQRREPPLKKRKAEGQKVPPRPKPDSFGIFNESEGDSDSESDMSKPAKTSKPNNEFTLGPEDNFDDDFNDTNDNDSNWKLTKESDNDDDDNDDDGPDDSLWDEARKEAASTKTREEERIAREKLLQDQAAHAADEREKDAKAEGDRRKALLLEEQRKNDLVAQELDRKTINERNQLKEQARQERDKISAHVDMDYQRELITNFENSYQMSGSGSPSSDFGF
eukprot:CAMPEP_0113306560 /NCGR_PEP_ID=MMETSP0010_2-20120614/5759_1 /TAXON_ID=216773 ORGANISM="Corethron hystrix, Strain 308" /NCGR_SAMPLE_ID=MMETSP0010_2 /ASSEMBLY_ACC=CAM_ASM_000155 /LENGTH=1218 /DNA_ID=CAMNT_0000161245 /DNA_START=488 /DNA_END=4144 /DNA_ORIENTATION=- /assembly_acc=CAM_ASM_000155